MKINGNLLELIILIETQKGDFFKTFCFSGLKLCIYFVEIKFQLDATEVFIADLIACSTCFRHHYAHHQELKSIIQWLLRVVFFAVVFQVAGLVWS